MHRRISGFALTELLAGCLIVATTAAVVLPAVRAAGAPSKRESAAICLANEEKLGQAAMLYSEDYNGKTPGGLNGFGGGGGWAGQIYPYVKSTDAFVCPADTANGTLAISHGLGPYRASSYGYNSNFTLPNPTQPGCSVQGDSVPMRNLDAPGRTVLLFEVTNSTYYNIDTETDRKRKDSPASTCGASPAGDGIGGSGSPSGYSPNGAGDVHLQYATGYPSGELNEKDRLSFTGPSGRHQVGGSNYLMADFHAVFLLPETVSAGQNAASATTNAIDDSDNQYKAAAAGTSGHLSDGVTVPAATYSLY